MNCSLECNVHEYTPNSVVLDDVIQVIRWTSAVNLSYDRRDFLQVSTTAGDIWKLCGTWIYWISGCNKFPCFFFLMIAPWFRFRKTLMTSDFYRSRQVPTTPAINPPMYASFSLPWELDAASGFEFLLALASSFPADALSISGLFDAIGWFTEEELVETVGVMFIAVGFAFATILYSSSCSCIRFVLR